MGRYQPASQAGGDFWGTARSVPFAYDPAGGYRMYYPRMASQSRTAGAVLRGLHVTQQGGA